MSVSTSTRETKVGSGNVGGFARLRSFFALASSVAAIGLYAPTISPQT